MAMKNLLMLALLVPLLSAGQDSLFTNDLKPAYVNTETRPLELGMHFYTDVQGMITHVRFYKSGTDLRTFQVRVYDHKKTKVIDQAYTASAPGWHRVKLEEPAYVTKFEIHNVSVYSDRGSWGGIWNYFKENQRKPPLYTFMNAGRFFYGSGYPDEYSGGQNYLVDLVFKAFPVDTVWMGETIKIYVPREGGYALNENSDTAYKALFGIFPPPLADAPRIYQFKYSGYRLTLYKNGAWIRERLVNGKYINVPYSSE
jgi:hypothetical protein